MHFRNAITVAAGLTIASGAAAAAFAVIFGDPKVFTPTLAIVALVAVCFGLPVYLTARSTQNDTPLVAIGMGFLLGAVIPALLVFGGAPDQASVDGVATVIDGSYTLAGWMQNLALIGFFGLLGVGGALVFWFIVRRRVSSEHQAEELSPSLLQTALLSVIAAGVVVAAFVIPYATTDRSCHNPLRGGGTSIAQTAGFDLHVDVDEWRNVEAEVAGFRRSGDWSVRNDVRTDRGFPWLQISLCKETGTNILVQGMSDFHQVSFGVYQPQGGDTWLRDFRALYARISARWPGKVTFSNSEGRPTGTPEWAAPQKLR